MPKNYRFFRGQKKGDTKRYLFINRRKNVIRKCLVKIFSFRPWKRSTSKTYPTQPELTLSLRVKVKSKKKIQCP